jgi:hypothetical protein
MYLGTCIYVPICTRFALSFALVIVEVYFRIDFKCNVTFNILVYFASKYL